MIYGWAPGISRLLMPVGVGLPVGSDTSLKGLFLEVHYDNPMASSMTVDHSGFRLYVTNQLRPQVADEMTVGDIFVNGDPIPPGLTYVEREFSCPSFCLQTTMTIFAGFLHMHVTGAQSWLTLTRNGVTTDVMRVDYYNFNVQSMEAFTLVVQPNDRLNIHCIYDSSSRTVETEMGVGTLDEMCMAFLWYYSAVPSYSYCGYLDPATSFCQDQVWSNVTATVSDPAGGNRKWFGSSPQNLQCPNVSVSYTATYSETGKAVFSESLFSVNIFSALFVLSLIVTVVGVVLVIFFVCFAKKIPIDEM